MGNIDEFDPPLGLHEVHRRRVNPGLNKNKRGKITSYNLRDLQKSYEQHQE
jgi:hypothetical protein